jgi:hypothetical protein
VTIVFKPVSVRYVLLPTLNILSVFGLVFEIPTFPDVKNDIPEFVNCIVFEVVLPVSHTCARVPVYVENTSVILTILPVESTWMTGFLPPWPYVPAVVAPVIFERYPPYPIYALASMLLVVIMELVPVSVK